MNQWFDNPIAEWIWETRYRAPQDRTIEDTWLRVARALSAPEADSDHWQARFFEALQGFRFVPAGRVLNGAGLSGDRTLVNCFVSGALASGVSAEAERLAEVVSTLESGGGVGADFSAVKGGKGKAGVVDFLRLWDDAAARASASGARRGALMGTLGWDHPEVMGFVHAKDDPAALNHFNLSVLLSEEFLAAAAEGRELAVGNARRVNARALLAEIAACAWQHGEPGVLFVDRINSENNLRYRENIRATNPCGEVPLPHHGACVLGSVNLVQLVQHPFSDRARLDFAALEDLVATGIRLLDNVIDVTGYPLPEQARLARATRRVGLGVMGLGDTLAMLGLRYGSDSSVELVHQIFERVRDVAYATSVELASERGAFPEFVAERFLESGFARRLPESLRKAVSNRGIRNSHLIAVAPTGTISLLANNVSGGIEPIFALTAERAITGTDGLVRHVELSDYAYRAWQVAGERGSPQPRFHTAMQISPAEHIAIQAGAQPFVDNAIAKTINLPEDASVDDVIDTFRLADRAGLKGCAVFRGGGTRCGVITPLHPDETRFSEGGSQLVE
jgi:ribonucleoside-diphosphate reductase alpha chain